MKRELEKAIERGDARASLKIESATDLAGIEKSKIQYLTLTAKLEVLPDLSTLKLKQLILKGKSVKSISALPSSLESAHLQSNQLESLPNLSKLTSLDTLDVSSNRLTALPKELWSLPKLRSVSATTNKIEKVGDEIGQATKLMSLHLDKNPGIDVDGLSSTSLQILGLRNCKLRSLSLGELPKLKNLSLGMNPLGEFPTSVFKYETLTTLYLWGCKLSSVPDQIASLKNLVLLELEKNAISELPEKLPPKLSTLFLEKNRFVEVPKAVFSLKHLTNLNLSNNTIDVLPDEIANLTKLHTLKVEGHPLKQFPADWSAMKDLKTFYLQGDSDTRALMRSQTKKLPPHAFIMMWEQRNRAQDVARDGKWA